MSPTDIRPKDIRPKDRVLPIAEHPIRPIRKSRKLDDVCYDIRGPVMKEAHRLEEEGHKDI